MGCHFSNASHPFTCVISNASYPSHVLSFQAALKWAIHGFHTKVAMMLIENGADVNATDVCAMIELILIMEWQMNDGFDFYFIFIRMSVFWGLSKEISDEN